MNDTTIEQPAGKIRKWFSIRLEKRIDQVWLSGVLLINPVVWLTLGAQYVATSLIAYFFVFTLFFRCRIQELFLPRDYYLLYNFDSRRITWFHGRGLWVFLIFFVMLMYTGHIDPIEYGLSFAIVPINILFIFAYKVMFRAYRADCAVHGVRKCTSGWYGFFDTKLPGFWIRCCQVITPVGALLLMIVLFVIAFWSYAIGDYSPFGMLGWNRDKRLFIVVSHVCFNIILFDTACLCIGGHNHDVGEKIMTSTTGKSTRSGSTEKLGRFQGLLDAIKSAYDILTGLCNSVLPKN